jgi:alkylation response protein AidB-like acyl-CoA dehydrogenase
MDFNDTPQEAEFRAKARAFLDKHLKRLDPSASGGDEFEKETQDDIARAKQWQATKFDAGWAVLTWPKEYGGQGLGGSRT